jgi:uncharacterized protein (DUF1330 family)
VWSSDHYRRSPIHFIVCTRTVESTLVPFGGKYIVRGGKVERLEGGWSPKRFVIVEFPSVERAKAWYHSTEYAEAKALRHECAESQIIVFWVFSAE